MKPRSWWVSGRRVDEVDIVEWIEAGRCVERGISVHAGVEDVRTWWCGCVLNGIVADLPLNKM